MNVYEFVKKAYGVDDLTPLKLYIDVPANPTIYQVTRVSLGELDLLTERGDYRRLGSDAKFHVVSVTLRGRLTKKKIVLHLTHARNL